MAHTPFDHVVDEKGHWTIFTKDLVGGDGLVLTLPTIPLPFPEPFHQFQITKFMLLEVIAAVLIIAIYVPLARRVASGESPKGAWWNAFEALLTFIRDSVARPSLRTPHAQHEGDHSHVPVHTPPAEHAHESHPHAAAHHADRFEDPDAEVDKYVPFLWTLFLFILFCNLLGMIPFMGSPTASIWMTGALGLCAFILFHGAATMKMGFFPYLYSIWPKFEMPLVLAVVFKPMIFFIELLGTVIKSFVLAVRLFANLFAGHLVLAFILGFIILANNVALGWFGFAGITTASVLGVVALSLLELFVAFLQAFIFTFLTALFLGMGLHPQH
jgi:F-type H+-transporting ATPase subunit a